MEDEINPAIAAQAIFKFKVAYMGMSTAIKLGILIVGAVIGREVMHP